MCLLKPPGVSNAKLDRFRRYQCGVDSVSPNTSASYARDLVALLAFLGQANVTDWRRVDSQHVRLFAARSHAGGLNPRSVQRRLSAVRGFFGYLVREGVVPSNPAVEIRAPKAAKRLPGTLDADQIAHDIGLVRAPRVLDRIGVEAPPAIRHDDDQGEGEQDHAPARPLARAPG